MKNKEFLALSLLLMIIEVTAVQTLYRDDNGGFGQDLKININSYVDAKMRSGLLDDFNFFGKPGPVDVYYNGLIGFDVRLRNDISGLKCQKAPNIDDNFLAVYWAIYDSGTVHMLEHDVNSGSVPLQNMIPGLLKDLKDGFGTDAFNNNNQIKQRTIDKINKVVVFTWDNMYLSTSTQGAAKRRRHVFQAVLTNVDITGGFKKWFVQTYYASIQSDGNWDHLESPGDQMCKKAQFGVSVNVNLGDRFITPYPLPSVLECLTNQYPFFDLGSWVFDINSDAEKQPNPPSLICTAAGITRDDKCILKDMAAAVKKMEQEQLQRRFIADIVNPETQRLADRYCEFRDAGLHKLPILCDVFIVCSLGKRSTVKICPPGQSYNPDIQTCDFAENFECFFQDVNLSEFTGVIATSIHGNICHYSGFGNVEDPNNCNTYYACTNARSIQMPCPKGLFYKPSSDTCEQPSDVQCTGNGDRSGAKR